MSDRVLNFNVGVLGHVDSGKTSLAKALSTVASTASFDKNPQSKERGITLDLGFSSFDIDIPDHLKDGKLDKLQFTLVDCPGHASLIRTIIGGAQIIDLMMLVIDVTKGMQTQTAECLVIGQIACDKMIVILNKVDQIPEAKRATSIEKMTKRMQKTLENTKFSGCPIIPVAAKPGGPDAPPECESIGIDTLIDTLKVHSFRPQRDAEGNLIFAVDHCFSIRGQGTVMTGTLLQGAVSVNDTIEIPSMKVTKKVKSMQMFRKPVNKVIQGDRAGLCVTQFDPKLLERGLVCSPGALPTIDAAVISVQRISYYKGTIASKAKFHVSMMHDTVMAKVTFFGLYGDRSWDETTRTFDFSQEYLYQDELKSMTGANIEDDGAEMPNSQFALLEFEKPITCTSHCLVIGSRLDTDIHSNVCRLAFHGRLLHGISDTKYAENVLPTLRVYKHKSRDGVVERKVDDYAVICKGLFKKESNMDAFLNLQVALSSGERGVIEGSFGQSGKFKVRIPEGLSPAAQLALSTKSGKKAKGKGQEGQGEEPAEVIRVTLKFKRYMYDPHKKMIQTT